LDKFNANLEEFLLLLLNSLSACSMRFLLTSTRLVAPFFLLNFHFVTVPYLWALKGGQVVQLLVDSICCERKPVGSILQARYV